MMGCPGILLEVGAANQSARGRSHMTPADDEEGVFHMRTRSLAIGVPPPCSTLAIGFDQWG